MTTAKLFTTGGSQAVRLPKEFRFEGKEVAIRRQGQAVVLEPIKKRKWPRGFFKSIRVSDPRFVRPPQGEMPPAPKFD
ncbi:MAG TPA: AbrB/MazE/SpoVT family DNA-binding domain-containing protein [Chthoniobacteraceae bacterium]|nr:AbrB/MazE/SpoVT family DNA-binding domain-containing protein [Chthoniobacteraceae bacterium]